MKALDIIKVVANQEWGADKAVLLNLYRSLIRSKLDYGCIVYGSARPSYLKMLNTVHHQGLRLVLGAFRTSPVESLYVEAGGITFGTKKNKALSSVYYQIEINSFESRLQLCFLSSIRTKILEEYKNNIPTWYSNEASFGR